MYNRYNNLNSTNKHKADAMISKMCGIGDLESEKEIAAELVANGYGNAQHAVNWFAERMKEILSTCTSVSNDTYNELSEDIGNLVKEYKNNVAI